MPAENGTAQLLAPCEDPRCPCPAGEPCIWDNRRLVLLEVEGVQAWFSWIVADLGAGQIIGYFRDRERAEEKMRRAA